MVKRRGQKNSAKRTIQASKYSFDERATIGKIGSAIGKYGIRPAQFRELLESVGFIVPDVTLRKWKRDFTQRGSVFSSTKKSGRKKKLLPEQLEIIEGFIVYAKLQKKLLTENSIIDFCNQHFSTNITAMSVRNYLKSLNCTIRIAEINTSKKNIKY